MDVKFAKNAEERMKKAVETIRHEATSRSLAATGQETTIEDGGTGEDVTLLGACALLLTRELGLTVHR